MIYEIRAGGILFYTADTDLLADNGVYHGNSNLVVRTSRDYNANTSNSYIFPATRTVYYRANTGGTYQYLTITSVTPLTDDYFDMATNSVGDFGFISIILLGVIAVCSLFKIFSHS